MAELIINGLIQSIPVMAALIFWAVRIENKITSMQTDIHWIKNGGLPCQQNSEKSIR